ncbi:hypothetical protein XELAEV_18036036mg [Xenopus laevis]|uniref:SAM domain-containing protein n=1 Tax=Xenopus laevis TaxID=8355 RepID=A0A974CGV0_XENLA|nr:hypothetical protein XELAEV_18036036mg [Xenopus laevis]
MCFSDYIIKEKTVLLQKKDSEGFGFVLRGAKGDTAIFNGSSIGWFIGVSPDNLKVNGQNVVKVGHRQVVNMIRQGGNNLMVKVVMVTRNPEMEDAMRKKVPQQTKRVTPPAISLRSKSMTSELEEMVSPWKKKNDYEPAQNTEKKRTVYQMALNKLDEILAAAQQTISVNESSSPGTSMGVSRAPGKGYFSSESNFGQHRVPSAQSMYERPSFLASSPSQAMMLRQKSIGAAEDDKPFLSTPSMKFNRSLSVPSSEDIPPPPTTSAPDPPYNTAPSPSPRVSPVIRSNFNQSGDVRDIKMYSPSMRQDSLFDQQMMEASQRREKMQLYHQDSDQGNEEQIRMGMASPANMRSWRSQAQEIRYFNLPARAASTAMYVPAKAMRQKGQLVKQVKVENEQLEQQQQQMQQKLQQQQYQSHHQQQQQATKSHEKSSIPIPTIIIKAPSTSSSGRSSQGSSMEAENQPDPVPIPTLPPSDNMDFTSRFGAAIVGAARRDREWFNEARRKSALFLSTDEDTEPTPAPRLKHSKSIDEGMFSSEPYMNLNISANFGHPVNRDINSGYSYQPKTGKSYGSRGVVTPLIHPLTGKILDPSSPLGLALAARERALKESQQHSRNEVEERKSRPCSPRFVEQQKSPIDSHNSPTHRHWDSGSVRKKEIDYKSCMMNPGGERKSDESSGHRSPALLLLQGVEQGKAWEKRTDGQEKIELHVRFMENSTHKDEEQHKIAMVKEVKSPTVNHPAVSSTNCVTNESNSKENGLPLLVLPPPAPSIDVDDDFLFTEPLPPPLEFSNSFDKPDSPPGPSSGVNTLPPPLPPPPPESGNTPALDSTTSSLTSYDSEVANLTQGTPELKEPHVNFSSVVSSIQIPASDTMETVTDSGIEEIDSRSSSDHHLETISSVSTLSSMSGLSTEGTELLDTYITYLDGQAFGAEKAVLQNKIRSRTFPSRTPGLLRDPITATSTTISIAPCTENVFTLTPSHGPSLIAPSDSTKDTQRKSPTLPWEDFSQEKTSPVSTGKPTMITELSSKLQHMSGVSWSRSPESAVAFTPERPSSLQRHRIVDDSSVSLISSKPVSSMYHNWPKSPQPPSKHPKSVDFDIRPSLRRAPSPSALPSEHKINPAPRPSSLPILPSAPVYTGVFDLRSSPTAGGESFPSFQTGSRSLSPTHFILPPTEKPFASKPVHFWTKFDVADWLDYLNLGEHREHFLDNEIDGSHLPSLTKEDYIDLGVTRVGHRMNIERALKFFIER